MSMQLKSKLIEVLYPMSSNNEKNSKENFTIVRCRVELYLFLASNMDTFGHFRWIGADTEDGYKQTFRFVIQPCQLNFFLFSFSKSYQFSG